MPSWRQRLGLIAKRGQDDTLHVVATTLDNNEYRRGGGERGL
ncbi:hypothetical protein [Alcanivorax sp.]|nr:hypothetical protein [Alcanivorax sp.]